MNKRPTNQSAMFTSFALLACLAAACDKDKAQVTEPTESQVSPNQGEQQTAEPARAALASYESIRASLAKDDIAATTAAAGSLEKSARAAAASASGAAKSHWSKLADAAKRLQAMPKQEADAVRKAFGEVSEPLVAVLKTQPELSKGVHVFECPMAQGYQKWVQADPKIANPYMGTRMLECGSETSL